MPGTVKAEALQHHLDRVRAEQFEQLLADPLAALPDHIDIALVIQSDAPCILTIDGFSIPYHLVRESFPEPRYRSMYCALPITADVPSLFLSYCPAMPRCSL